MDTKLIKMLAIAALAMGMTTGCDSDDGSSDNASCSESSVKCDGGAMYSCSGGTWVKGTACSTGKCENAAKCETAAGAVCVSGESKCESGKIFTCNGADWGTGIACPSGVCADNTNCKTESTETGCQNGTVKCENNAQYACQNNAWSKLISCSLGCAPDGENCAAETCSGSETKCNGAYVMTCTGGSFVKASEPCANGCYQGACKGTDTPVSSGKKVGDPCSAEEKGASYCDGDKLIGCDGSTIVAGPDCSSYSMYCDDIKDYAGKGLAECAVECDASQNKTIVDMAPVCENGKFALYACFEGASGKYSVFTYNYVDTVCVSENMAATCSSANGDVVPESCTNCTTVQTSGVSTCSGAKKVTGKSSGKLGGACTTANEVACDGNTLVYCDGSKYQGLLKGNSGVYSCAEAYGIGYYCDETTLESGDQSVRVADCVRSCSQEANGYFVDYDDKCKNGKINMYVCLESDAGNMAVWGTSISIAKMETVCKTEKAALVCSSENGDVVEKTCTSCEATETDSVCK